MKTSKKSLLLSIVSIILCLAMLLGTTYAWFTDSVQSGTNQIVAGNLDVELHNADGKVDENTELFSDVELWEPGAVAYETLTVKNVGTLAFNYQMSILAENEVAQGNVKLSEILKVGVIDGAVAAGTTREALVGQIADTDWKPLQSFTQQGNIDAGGDDVTQTYVIYWQPGENDNLYNMNNGNQGKTLSIDLGVMLVAGQKTKEVDSFNDQYDYSAFIQVTPDNFEGIIAGLKGGESLYLKEGTYNVTANDKMRINASNVTIVGAGVDATVIDTGAFDCGQNGAIVVSGDNVTIANLTVKSSSTVGSVSPIKVTNLNSEYTERLVKNVKIDNVALEGSKGHGLNLHGVDGAIINGVDVRSYGKCAIACAKAKNVTFTNNKTAVAGWPNDIGCMYSSDEGTNYNAPCSITIGEGNEFGNGKIYSERPSAATDGKDVITFADSSAWVKTDTDNGWTVVPAAAKIGNTGYATLQDAVNAATAGNEVVMLKDVTISGSEKIVIPANATVSIDGKDHTVSFEKTAAFSMDKNAVAFSLKNAKVVKLGTQGGYAVVTPHGFGGSVSIDNCTLENLKYGVYMDPTDSLDVEAFLSITNCKYVNTVWGYCFDDRSKVTTKVTVVAFTDNTGIADDHIRESFA